MGTQVKRGGGKQTEMFTTSFRISRGDYAALQQLAVDSHRTASAQLRYLIARATQEHADEQRLAA